MSKKQSNPPPANIKRPDPPPPPPQPHEFDCKIAGESIRAFTNSDEFKKIVESKTNDICPPPETPQGVEQIKPVRRSRSILCKNCVHFIGLNADNTKYLCWRKRMYSDPSGETRRGEICETVNEKYNCASYKVKWTKIISAYFA